MTLRQSLWILFHRTKRDSLEACSLRSTTRITLDPEVSDNQIDQAPKDKACEMSEELMYREIESRFLKGEERPLSKLCVHCQNILSQWKEIVSVTERSYFLHCNDQTALQTSADAGCGICAQFVFNGMDIIPTRVLPFPDIRGKWWRRQTHKRVCWAVSLVSQSTHGRKWAYGVQYRSFYHIREVMTRNLMNGMSLNLSVHNLQCCWSLQNVKVSDISCLFSYIFPHIY